MSLPCSQELGCSDPVDYTQAHRVGKSGEPLQRNSAVTLRESEIGSSRRSPVVRPQPRLNVSGRARDRVVAPRERAQRHRVPVGSPPRKRVEGRAQPRIGVEFDGHPQPTRVDRRDTLWRNASQERQLRRNASRKWRSDGIGFAHVTPVGERRRQEPAAPRLIQPPGWGLSCGNAH